MTNRQSARKKRQMTWHKEPGARHQFDPLLRIAIDPSRLNKGNSYSLAPLFCAYENESHYYKDIIFSCRDCGKECLWTAENQKWWYEEIQGSINTIATRCLACRIKERERKTEARRASKEGMQRKLARLAALQNNTPE